MNEIHALTSAGGRGRKLSSSKPFPTPRRYRHQKSQLTPFAHWPPASFPPRWLFIHPANVSAMLTLRQAARTLMMNTSSDKPHLCLSLAQVSPCLSVCFPILWSHVHAHTLLCAHPVTLSAMVFPTQIHHSL